MIQLAVIAVTASCHFGAGGALPDHHCTPGALNPAVTQATIQKTICVHGWTKTIRPPESVTAPEKLASMARYGVSADSVIAEMIDADSAARRLVVVSTDREVARSARRRRAQPMRSDDFWAVLQSDLAGPATAPLEPLEKRAGLSPGATDAWLKELGLE